MHLFIDTNIFLSFYKFTSDDLEKLSQLAVLLEAKKILLHFPEQVGDEFIKNREQVISESIKKLTETKFNVSYPALCKAFPEYRQAREHQKALQEAINELRQNILNGAKERTLLADVKIGELHKYAMTHDIDADCYSKAMIRMERDLPPGKNRSIGDAINWELLLHHIPDECGLHLISDDKDFKSDLTPEAIHSFLHREWKRKKNSSIYLYTNLSKFFKEHYPEIQLASELQVEISVEALVNSSGYTQTHAAINRLRNFDNFTNDQINKMISAGLKNGQISRILSDGDVFDFYHNLIRNYSKEIEGELFEDFVNQLKQNLPDWLIEVDLPF